MTPDAVIGLIQRLCQIHAVIGQIEPFAQAQATGCQYHPARPLFQFDHMFRIDLVGNLEQYTMVMQLAPRFGQGRPGGIGLGQRQIISVCAFISQPMADLTGKGQLVLHPVKRVTKARGQRLAQCRTIKLVGLVGADPLGCPALHE